MPQDINWWFVKIGSGNQGNKPFTHYISQCWLTSLSLYGIIMPQRMKLIKDIPNLSFEVIYHIIFIMRISKTKMMCVFQSISKLLIYRQSKWHASTKHCQSNWHFTWPNIRITKIPWKYWQSFGQTKTKSLSVLHVLISFWLKAWQFQHDWLSQDCTVI